MPAPHNPYRRRNQDLGYDLIGTPIMREGRIERRTEEPVGFNAIDIEDIAQRNYTLGRQHGFRDREQEVGDLRRRLDAELPQAYDEGYEAAEREVVELIANLLSPSAELAADISVGKAATGRNLTPKQREEAKDQLVGSIQTAIRALEHAIREEVKSKIATGTIERLRDAMREHA